MAGAFWPCRKMSADSVLKHLKCHVERSRSIRESFANYTQELQRSLPSISQDLAEVSKLQACAEEMTEVVRSAFAANTSAITAALEFSNQLQQRIAALEMERERMLLLAVFRDPIQIIRDIIAVKMGFTHWEHLAAQLRIERHASSQSTQANLEIELIANGLDTVVWSHLQDVADAGNLLIDKGTNKSPLQAMHLVRYSIIPKDLLCTKCSLDKAFVWLAKAVHAL